MGLDMYFTKETYVKNWGHTPIEEQFQIDIKRGGNAIDHINPERLTGVIEEVAYWRKFNALHNWFVENCQDGVDDCRKSYVSTEKIEELLETLKKVTENPEMSEELLPTTSGHFFGGCEYDEYYFEEITDTIEILENVLKDEEKYELWSSFYYQSSW